MFSQSRTTEHRSGDDLLSAGLGLDGLRSMLPPAFADAAKPTADELRRRALWSNWRGIADLVPGGGYGDVYGSVASVPGREFSAFATLPGATQPHRVLLQLPDAFDAEQVIADGAWQTWVFGPSLLFMGISSCLRGYFIARRRVSSSSNAQLFEQAVRMAVVFVLIDHFAPMGLSYACGAVLAADTERAALMAEAETAHDPHRIAEIQHRLSDIDAWSAEGRASSILKGLGFDADQQLMPCSAFSGGWRMRVALAGVLFGAAYLIYLNNIHEKEIATKLQKNLSFGITVYSGLAGAVVGMTQITTAGVSSVLVWLIVGGVLNFVAGLPIYLSFKKGIFYGVQ